MKDFDDIHLEIVYLRINSCESLISDFIINKQAFIIYLNVNHILIELITNKYKLINYLKQISLVKITYF